MKLTLVNKIHHVDNIWTFAFKPAEPILYEAGQFIRVRLDHENVDAEGPKRFFTNSAPPYMEAIHITTRITESSFKHALSSLKPGDDSLQMINPPEGDFLWEASTSPTIFVAAGIGVTPYYAILAERVHANEDIPATLLYNGRNAQLPWKNEFASLEQTNSEFKVVYQIGDRITADGLKNTFPDLNTSIVYLSGPEHMVEDVGEALKRGGLPESQLMQDWFPNYDDSSY